MIHHHSTYFSVLQRKYKTFYERLAKAIASGQFYQYTNKKQTALRRRLARYEQRLIRWGVAVGSVATFFVTPVVGVAQVPLGSVEFKVNTYTTDTQYESSVAMDDDGDFVVVWESSEQDSSGYGIYGQRYNSNGTPVGSEFRVNTYTSSDQSRPSVAMDSDGDFVVVWQDNNQDGFSYGVYGQRYNSSGTPVGAEFQANTYTIGNQFYPSVAIDNDGDFVLVWQGLGQDGYGIYGRRYNTAGVAQGAEFRVNSYITGSQTRPAVAIDSDGDFVVIWTNSIQDGDGYGIYGQRYNNNGTANGSEFMVNTYTTSTQRNPSVAIDNDGDFLVVWQSYGQDSFGYGIYAQRYDNNGTKNGSEFLVNTYTTNIQRDPSVAIASNGEFVIVWQSFNQDCALFDVYGQYYNSSGVAQNIADFKINVYVQDSQTLPVVAMDSDGDFVVAWGSYNQDGSYYGIYAQRYNNNPIPSQQVCGTNILYNPGFDIPIQPFLGDNVTNCFSFNGWTMTNGPFNIVKVDGNPYGAGPDIAVDGGQYIDVAFATGTVYQDFTISGNSTNITFGGSFSSRTGGLWTASIDIFSMPSDTLVASSNTKDITGDDIEVWSYLSGNVTLAPGTYRYVANIGDDGNFDAASVILNQVFLSNPLPIGITDETCAITIQANFQSAQEYDISSDVSITLLPNTQLVAGSDVHLFINTTPTPLATQAVATVNDITTRTEALVAKDLTAQNYPIIYPNPTASTIEIGLKAAESIESVEIFDPMGKLVKIFNHPTPTIALDDLHSGWYILRININGAVYIKRIVKQ